MSFTFETEISTADGEVTIGVEVSIWDYPGRTQGDPEDCYPADCGEDREIMWIRSDAFGVCTQIDFSTCGGAAREALEKLFWPWVDRADLSAEIEEAIADAQTPYD